MVQLLNAKPTFASRFTEKFNPSFQQGLSRFLEESAEEDREQRRSLLEQEKEARQLKQQEANAEALGLPKAAINPTVQSALLKEKAKDERNQQLLDLLGNRGETSETSQKRQGFQPENFSDEDIAGISVLNPTLGNLFQKQKESKQKLDADEEKNLRKKFETDREFEWKRAGEVLKTVDNLRDSIEEKRTAANLIKQTAGSQNTSGWNQWFADVLGVEPLRSADSALLKSATKDFFINNLAKAGSRPNQWIEQQISDAMVKIGRDPEANMKVAELMNYWVDREEEKVKVFDQLQDEDLAEFGYIKGNIAKRAGERMKSWEDQRRDNLMYDLQSMTEKNNPDDLEVIRDVPKGTPLTLEKARVFKRRYGKDAEKAAKNAGYDIEIYSRVAQ